MKSNDTTPEFAAIVQARFQALTGAERLQMAASMFDSARAIARSAVGDDRLALLDRLYPELRNDAALRARVAMGKG